MPSSVQAQFIQPLELKDTRNQQVMSDLQTALTNNKELGAMRGGKLFNKPLGQYMLTPNSEYKSAYKSAPVELQAQFAYDLHEMIKAKGRDWPAWQRNSNLEFLSYNKQNDFADMWWLRNYKAYKDLPFFYHDGFLSDALLDATLSYNWYARKDYASADYAGWQDVVLRELIKKK